MSDSSADSELSAAESTLLSDDRESRQLQRGGAWVLSGRVLGMGLAFLSNLALARLLSPQDFGLFILCVSVITFGSAVARAGLDRVIVRFVSEFLGLNKPAQAYHVLRLAFCIALASTLATSLLIYVGGVAFGRLLTAPPAPSLVLTVAIAICAITFLNLTGESLRAFGDIRLATLYDVQTAGPLINLVFLVALGVASMLTALSFPLTLGLYAGSFVVLLPIALYCLRRKVAAYVGALTDGNFDSDGSLRTMSMLAICLPLAGTAMLEFASSRGSIWIAGALCAGDDLAQFGASYRLIQLVVIPLGMVNLTILSSIPALYAQCRLDRLQSLLQTTAVLAAAPAFAITVMFILLPGPIMSLVFGPFYREAAPILIILSLGQLVASWTGSCGFALLMTGRHHAVLVTNLSTTILLFVAGPIAAIQYGIVGFAVVSGAVVALKNLALWLLARQLVGVWTHATIASSIRLLVRDRV